MWKCRACGEEENESAYKFCLTCGAPKPTSEKDLATESDIESAFRIFSGDAVASLRDGALRARPAPAGEERESKSHMKLAGIGKLVKQAVHPDRRRDMVELPSETGEKIDRLVRAGVFSRRSEAAGYLLEEGIKAQAELFELVGQKLAEIERIEKELQALAARQEELEAQSRMAGEVRARAATQ